MKPRQDEINDLFQLLDQWKQITEAEHHSILTEDWIALDELQSSKSEIQLKIDRAHARAFPSPGGPPQSSLLGDRLKEIAAELLDLEAKNRQLLAQRLAATDSELKKLNKTSQSLKHVHRAYGSADRSFWQAYS